MKNLLTLTVAILYGLSTFAQGIPVSTSPEKRNAVLEEFTGIHCVYCPDGHRLAQLFSDNNPGDVVLVNIHAGGYAVPNSGEPDFRTNYGTSLANLSGLCGYPAGTMNRQEFQGLTQTGSNGCVATTAMGRSAWTNAGNQVLGQDAPANVGVEAEIDVQTRELTVTAQVYYTSNAANSSNRLNIALLQNNIEGPQTGASSFNQAQILPNGNYNHNHMLRHFLTGQWGDNISPTTTGTTINKTYTYNIPASINGVEVILADLEIAAYLVEGTTDIITGHTIDPEFVNFTNQLDVAAISAKVEQPTICGFTATPTVTVMNNGSSTVAQLYIDYSINNGPVNTYVWGGTLTPLNMVDITLNATNYFPSPTNTIEYNIYSPNGSTDENSTNDANTSNFASAVEVSQNVTMTLQLDYYGSEVEWELVNSAGSVLYSGGPYSDVSNPQSNPPLPSPIVENFSLASGDCYDFKVMDDYGDGLLGSGAGFTLIDDQNTVIVQDLADYGSGDNVPFGIDVPEPDSSDVFGTVGIQTIDNLKSISLFPNPVNDNAQLSVNFSNDTDVSIALINILGQKVKSFYQNKLIPLGQQYLTLDVANVESGIYFVQIKSNDQQSLTRLVVDGSK